MCKPSLGLFSGTKGEQNGKQTEMNLHFIEENLPLITEKFPITDTGYFGHKGKNSRVIESSDPVSTSQDFYSRIGANAEMEVLANGKGTRTVFPDGTTVTHRIITSTPGSPAVDINIKSDGPIKTQKIHFVKG